MVDVEPRCPFNRRWWIRLLVVLTLGLLPKSVVAGDDAAEYFEAHVRPIFCGDAKNAMGRKSRRAGFGSIAKPAGREAAIEGRRSRPANRKRACSSRPCAITTKTCKCLRAESCRTARWRPWSSG